MTFEELDQEISRMTPGQVLAALLLLGGLMSNASGEADWHMHKCEFCGTVWTHDLHAIPQGKYDDAHSCPTCQTVQFKRYSGGDKPEFCANGARTLDMRGKT